MLGEASMVFGQYDGHKMVQKKRRFEAFQETTTWDHER